MSELSKRLRRYRTNHESQRVRAGLDGDWVTVSTTELEHAADEIDSWEGAAQNQAKQNDELEQRALSAESKLDLATKALHEMANDGWMMHGVEGYSAAQQALSDAMDVIGWPDGHKEPPK